MEESELAKILRNVSKRGEYGNYYVSAGNSSVSILQKNGLIGTTMETMMIKHSASVELGDYYLLNERGKALINQ